MDEELYQRMQQQMKDGFMRAVRGWYAEWLRHIPLISQHKEANARAFLYEVLDGCKDFPVPLNGWVLEALELD